MNHKDQILNIKNNLSKGRYTCINFTASNQNERNKYITFFRKNKDLIDDHYNTLSGFISTTCFTIFTIPNDRFNEFRIYNSEKGEHMIDGSFKCNNPKYSVSPLMNYDEFVLYMGKYMCISEFMYKSKKFSREI